VTLGFVATNSLHGLRRQALAEPATAPCAELGHVHVALDAEHGCSIYGHGGVCARRLVLLVLVVECWAGQGGWIGSSESGGLVDHGGR